MNVAVQPDSRLAIEQLCQRLEELSESGASRFDPVRFRYLQSMARRALHHNETVAAAIMLRAKPALEAFEADYKEANVSAATLALDTAAQGSKLAQLAQVLLEQHDYTALKKLQARSEMKGQGFEQTLHRIEQLLPEAGELAAQESNLANLQDYLHFQEEDLLSALLEDTNLDANENPRPREKKQRELKSVRQYRESWLKESSVKLVSRAIEQSPDNPGPLNPDMLATQSLVALRSLSPSYLKRFIPFVETLLWLEKTNDKATNRKRKKAR